MHLQKNNISEHVNQVNGNYNRSLSDQRYWPPTTFFFELAETFSISIRAMVVAEASQYSQGIHCNSYESNGIFDLSIFDIEQQAFC